jgi:hypothetical protein
MTEMERLQAKIDFHKRTAENLQKMHDQCLPGLLHTRPALEKLIKYHLDKSGFLSQDGASFRFSTSGVKALVYYG